ncbi:MAG TPA: tetratricopeptide repeat protein [Vicinamibacterales bacterium]|nr:tetratricopeptide repeat protein [Vicinamibacterales bacterium]
MAALSTSPTQRLESWKEIASYLNRSERTVRRWEEKEGLPVHRLAHDKRGSVYAFTSELEAWRESRRQLVESEAPEASQAPSTERRLTWWPLASVVAIVALAAGVWWLNRSAPQSAGSPHPEAVRLVTLAGFAGNAGRTQIETGIRYYQDAIRIDPRYAPAWTGLANAHLVRIWFGEVRSADALMQVQKETAEAMRLDPTSGGPWRVRAAASHFVEWDHARAETEFRKAMELAPNEAVGFSWYADYLLDLRRFDEARVYYRRAHELAPRWLEPIAFVGNTHLFAGNPDLAIAEYERALESEPNFGLGIHFLGRAYIAKGEYDRGIAHLRKSNELLGEIPFSLGDLGNALAIAGKRDEAEALRADLIARRTNAYYPAFPIGLIELGLGNLESALDWLERAVEERSLSFYFPSVDPSYDVVRAHPRFKNALKLMNLDTVSH